MTKKPTMTETFRDALMWHMARHKTTIAALAAGSGVSADTIKKLRTRDLSSTKAEAASKIAAFYGKNTAEFMRCEDDSGGNFRLSSLIDQLTPEEARMIALQVQGILAARVR